VIGTSFGIHMRVHCGGLVDGTEVKGQRQTTMKDGRHGDEMGIRYELGEPYLHACIMYAKEVQRRGQREEGY
jgi:hypothetical protein